MVKIMGKSNSVLVALSGGIDSSVAAYLLKDEGYRVAGLYLNLVDEKLADQSSLVENRDRLSLITQKLNIPLYEIDYREDFFKIVVSSFIEQYNIGITPNPCILCNEKVKFKLLYEFALKKGFDYIATGHYVRLEKNLKNNRIVLKRGIDNKKDQSYFLYRINETILSKCLFPLGILSKEETRRIAQKNELSDSFRKESQEICFISGNDYRKLLTEDAKNNNKTGYFLDTSGNILGKHQGISRYTVGQRRKTGLSLNSRKYVIEINPYNNTVIIGDETELYQQKFRVRDVVYNASDPILESTKMLVQIRYNSLPALAILNPIGETELEIIFEEAQRAITPGQSAVFYDGDKVTGGGIIT